MEVHDRLLYLLMDAFAVHRPPAYAASRAVN
jgi:hypothetical protein